jgi:hypothetical protein
MIPRSGSHTLAQLDDPVIVHYFELLESGDYKWLRGEEYDNGFDLDDLCDKLEGRVKAYVG